MKIFCVDIDSQGEISFYIKPETAVVRNNEPVYIPDFATKMVYNIGFAVKVHRITKAIGERFASRCWNEVALAVAFYCGDLLDRCAERGVGYELAKAFDKSYVQPNNFESLDHFLNCHERKAQACIDGMVYEFDWSEFEGQINRVIAYISQYVTLKIGDVIMINDNMFDTKIASANQGIELFMGDKLIARTDIK